MGNISSQIGNSSQKYKIEPEAQLSLPRINQQQKVLPSKEPRPKLRSTENGKILLAGGTLTGRHQEKVSGRNFMNAKEKVNFIKELQEDKFHSADQEEHMKKFGSEPDLRYHLNKEKLNLKPKRYSGTKKLTQTNNIEKRSNETEFWASSDLSARRIGLFRTRMESKKLVSKTNEINCPDNAKRNKLDVSERCENSKRNSFPERHKVTPLMKKPSQDDVYSQKPDIDNVDHFLEETVDYFKQNHVKKYYFGMDNNSSKADLDSINYEMEDYKPCKISDEVQSNVSNNLEEDDSQKILLYLRPVLPKKQIEMPKFSSSIAWKLLYSAESDSNVDCSMNNDDDQYYVEDRIEKNSSSPKRLSMKSIDFQFSQDKSGDSGISGDETPKPVLSHYKSKQSWTPQQDLGDDSSTDEEVRFNSMPCYNTNKPHVFSLSLPRDHMTGQYTMDRQKSNSYFQYGGATINKLKRSVSGVLGNNYINNSEMANPFTIKNCNWLLSKSAPNSLNNGFTSLDSTYVYNEMLTSLVPINGQYNKGRIIYLPHGDYTGGIMGEQRNDTKHSAFQNMTSRNETTILSENFIQEANRKEQERLKEIEAMQRIEEEFRRKRSRYNGLYSNNQQDLRRVLLSTGEKSV